MTADIDLKQGTLEWRQARAGSLGAASMHAAFKKLKNGKWSAEREHLMDGLIAERLTGIPWQGYVTSAMAWGTANEPKARAAYSAYTGVPIIEVGLIRHPSIAGAHASPDGVTDDLGLIEIKCPTTATHLRTIEQDAVPAEYIDQLQWQMACMPDREGCDFVSFDPRVAPAIQFHLITVLRDHKRIAELEQLTREFLAELEARIAKLAATYGDLTPPPPPDDLAGFEDVDLEGAL